MVFCFGNRKKYNAVLGEDYHLRSIQELCWWWWYQQISCSSWNLELVPRLPFFQVKIATVKKSILLFTVHSRMVTFFSWSQMVHSNLSSTLYDLWFLFQLFKEAWSSVVNTIQFFTLLSILSSSISLLSLSSCKPSSPKPSSKLSYPYHCKIFRYPCFS